ncbi:zinc finger protein 106 [Polymixia lowei]
MGRQRKCILCEMVCNSKQEMDEHMRSMLHHRELENLKGRDCGHECKVCQVTVVSLTDYASHISSLLHKQSVEAAEREHAGNNQDEDYFDQQLVDLIEKRKELIRTEEEAAAARRAEEEAKQKKQQEFQHRLKEAKERFRLDCGRRQPPSYFSGSTWQGAWNGNNPSGGRAGQAVADSRPWHQSRQGKSATWHAQEPPDLRRWDSGQWPGGSMRSQEGWGNNQWHHGAFSGSQRGRLPWLSNRGSSNGVYGWNNISQFPQRGRPLSFFGPLPSHPSPPSLFSHATGPTPNHGMGQGGRPGERHPHGEGPDAECDRNSDMNPKTFGSNPKLDKACRWSPYPPTKLFDPAPQKEAHPSPSEKYPNVPTPQKQEKAPDTTSVFNAYPRDEEKTKHLSSSGGSFEGKKHTNRKHRGRSSSRNSGGQRDGHKTPSPSPSKQKANKSSEHRDRKLSLIPRVKNQLRKASSQEHEQPKSTSKHGNIGPLKSRQEQQLPEMLSKAKETVLDKRLSMDIAIETALHIVEEQQGSHPESQVGANKENNCRQDDAKPSIPELIRPSPCAEEDMELVSSSSSDSRQFLQLVQVSTSIIESSASVASGKEEEEEGKEREEEEEMGLGATDEATQAAEAGQGSESDTSRSGEAQTASASSAPSLSQLGLPPALKRDLTKHISSKSKAGSHEPNLNSARRVRNVSESRKGEAEKESGLKPTVRQLISSSGSRRNVNWEQVYQEVRKKQEQGKGMPRFGIEMVSCDHEEQSQEEDDMSLLEGFQWESLMDAPSPVTPRKRCLSESSVQITPNHSASANFLFPSQTSGETTHRDGLGRPGTPSERPGSSSSSSLSQNLVSAQANRDNQRQQELERMLRRCEAQAQKRSDGGQQGTGKALLRSDSALGDSSSGTELYDAQGTGKKRRAAGDIPSPEIPSLERKNKRRKIKSKRERLQVDQLLAVSLREEELSRSLQTLDSSLIQARAALEAAYLEVQRLTVVKQQVTTEMSTLRNQRIELLKGMKGGFEDSAQPKVKEEKIDSVVFEPHVASTLSFAADAAVPSPSHAAQGPRCASPPSSSSSCLPFLPVVIKQEPLSPVRVGPEPDPPAESAAPCPHSATPELPRPPATASHSDVAHHCKSSPQRPDEADLTQESLRAPAECKESSSGTFEMMEKTVQATGDDITPSADSKPASRRSSEAGSLGDPPCEPPSAPRVLGLPLSPAESKSGRRVRRLKKRRVLNKAQGAEQPESSDTEVDEEASKRPTRTRRRPSGGSRVSTSTPPAAEDGDGVREGVEGTSPATKPRDEDLDLPLEMAELPQTAPTDAAHVDSSEPEESMEITAAYQQSRMDCPSLAPPPAPAPDPSRAAPHNLACNEVTSTSDMDVSPVVKPYESDVQMPLALPKMSKTASDASSDLGEDDTPTEGAFEGHQEAVNAMQVHNGLLYTCSGDRTVRAFSLVSRKCVSVFEGHSSKVNCLLVSAVPSLQQRLYSGSSDQTIRCYSLKTREFEQQFSLPDRVLCFHSRWKVLYAGLANGTVVTFNLKTNKQLDVFECHGPRAVSCLASAQEGARKILLVGSYDSTISVRDAKNGLLLRTLEGHTKTVLCMKVVNDLVFSGSSDQSVHAHNIHTGDLVRIYKGHSHAVTVVTILGKVMVTASLDKLVRVYELQSQDRLQVYGGHKDMVMCMAVHKNMIYTGCYDGSVQAVKLNLMQNYRCLWHGCSLIFSVMDHLQQHLIDVHTSPNFQTLKCRWKNCDEFFCARNGSKQGMLTHMQKHAEEAVKLEP